MAAVPVHLGARGVRLGPSQAQISRMRVNAHHFAPPALHRTYAAHTRLVAHTELESQVHSCSDHSDAHVFMGECEAPHQHFV